MSWSPDGEVLLAANGAQQQHNTICAFARQTWELTTIVGHSGAVLVTSANPRLFYPARKLQQQRMQEGEGEEGQQQQGEGQQEGASAAAAAGGSGVGQQGGEGDEIYGEEAGLVFAAGSTDTTMSIWSSTLQRPMLLVNQVGA
jgi:hypothetical protein